MIFSQIFNMVSVGIVILDLNLNVFKWNRWMESHSGIQEKKIVGKNIFDFYPELKTPGFLRNCKSVLTFGNFSFFSQKLHKYFFPFKPVNTIGFDFKYMQQSCTMGPLRDENNQIQYLYIMVQDVTEVAAYQQKLIEMNIRDALTNIYNRRHFETRLREEIERNKRYSRSLSLIIQDIDFFKKINDTYGHQCGDMVLKNFAALISSSIRSVDIFARYGGEEFCCLLPETNSESAKTLGENLRKKIKNHIFQFENTDIKITISQGIAELNEKVDSAEALIRRADQALYNAKESGRDKVVVFT